MTLHPSRRRPLVILLAVCVALAVLGVALFRRGSLPTTQGAASRQVAAERRPLGKVLNGVVWQIGDQRTYDVKLRSTVHLAVTGGDEAKTPVGEIGVNVEGSWRTMVVSTVEGGPLVLGKLTATKVATQGSAMSDAPEDDPALRTAVAQPILLRYSPRGTLVGIRLSPELASSPSAAGLVRSLAASLAASLPDQLADRWELEETDTTGAAVVSYTRTAGGELERRKLRYAWVASPQGRHAPGADNAVTPSGMARLALDEEGWAERVRLDEQISLAVVGAGLGDRTQRIDAASHTVCEADLVARGSVPGAAPPADWVAWEEHSVADPTLAAALEQNEVDAGKRISLTDLVMGLERLAKLPVESAGRTRNGLLELMVRKVAADPEAAGALARRVMLGLPDLDASAVIGALGSEGKAASQRALVDLVRHEALPPAQRLEALAALGLVTAPTSETVAETRLAAHSTDADLRSTGSLALGSQAHGLADDDAAASRSIVDELIAMWKVATMTSERILALQSLGNSRDPRLVPIVEEALALADQTVRDAAVRALHGIGGDSVDTLIGRVLRQDPAPLPRRGAAACVVARSIVTFLPDLGYALQHDAESMVRLEIVNTLAGAAATSDLARSLLQTVAAGDATKSVRDAARDVLASRSVGADADATP